MAARRARPRLARAARRRRRWRSGWRSTRASSGAAVRAARCTSRSRPSCCTASSASGRPGCGCPPSLKRHEALWILPVGAVASALEHRAARLRAGPVRRRARDRRARERRARHLRLAPRPGPALARRAARTRRRGGCSPCRSCSRCLIGAIALLPMFRGGFVTVIGNGSDAHLAVGTAQFLQKNGPKDVDANQAVDRVPLVWRSKPPIYLSYGAVARVAGKEPYAVIATLAAALLAMAALGFWLLARELLGAGPWGAARGDGARRDEPDRALHRHAPLLQPDVGLHGDALCDRARVVRRAPANARRRAAVRGVPRRRRVRLPARAAGAAVRRDRVRRVRAPAPRAVAAADPAAALEEAAAVDRAAVLCCSCPRCRACSRRRRPRRACSRPATRS